MLKEEIKTKIKEKLSLRIKDKIFCEHNSERPCEKCLSEISVM